MSYEETKQRFEKMIIKDLGAAINLEKDCLGAYVSREVDAMWFGYRKASEEKDFTTIDGEEIDVK